LTVTPIPVEGDELEFTLVVAGIPSLKVLCRMRATQTFGNKEAYEMICAEGVKLVRPQEVDRIVVALDSSIPGYEVYGTEASLLDQIKRCKPTWITIVPTSSVVSNVWENQVTGLGDLGNVFSSLMSSPRGLRNLVERGGAMERWWELFLNIFMGNRNDGQNVRLGSFRGAGFVVDLEGDPNSERQLR
jgi:hypothetical protein